MKRKSIYLFILAGLIALSGCLDDKNNYDYTDINELEGEITGMKRSEGTRLNSSHT